MMLFLLKTINYGFKVEKGINLKQENEISTNYIVFITKSLIMLCVHVTIHIRGFA